MKQVEHNHAQRSGGLINFKKTLLISLLILWVKFVIFPPLWETYNKMLTFVLKDLTSPRSVSYFFEAVFCIILINIPFIIIAYLVIRRFNKPIKYVYVPVQEHSLKKKSLPHFPIADTYVFLFESLYPLHVLNLLYPQAYLNSSIAP